MPRNRLSNLFRGFGFQLGREPRRGQRRDPSPEEPAFEPTKPPAEVKTPQGVKFSTVPPRQIPLSGEQIDEIMADQWSLRVATIGPGSRINLTPMWFGWAGGAIYFYGRGQKIANLRRNPACTVIVDRNAKYPEFQGVMLQGHGRVLEDTEAEKNDPHLENVRAQMGMKYNGGYGQPLLDAPPPFAATARGRNRRWVVMAPEYTVSWDHYKLSRKAAKGKEPTP